MKVTIRLPWPPSVNHYWRSVVFGRSVRVLISRKGRQYRDAVTATVRQQFPALSRPTSRNLAVVVNAFPPDRRRRDGDNVVKAVFDAITHAGVWADDSQVKAHAVVMADVVTGGEIQVEIEVINGPVEHGGWRPAASAANG